MAAKDDVGFGECLEGGEYGSPTRREHVGEGRRVNVARARQRSRHALRIEKRALGVDKDAFAGAQSRGQRRDPCALAARLRAASRYKDVRQPVTDDRGTDREAASD